MSLAPVSVPDRQPSPGLTVNLGSNNPFRNRTSSPSLASPSIKPERPLSTNPFVDDQESQSTPNKEMSSPAKRPTDPEMTGHAAELFENLSLEQSKPKPSGRRPPPPRPENIPPDGSRERKGPPRRPRPHPSSREDGHRGNRTEKPNTKPLIDVFADPKGPPKAHSHRRPRRNSDSSLVERPAKPLDPEDEKRRRERRHRERESRHKDGKSRSKKPPGRRLDLIDKLDVTGIYGEGLFHHDGPFDACNPHRNRRGLRSTPMQAFPKDSRNMALGGSGPNNKNLDLNQFHGRGEEGYTDFSSGAVTKSGQGVSFDPATKLEMIHGEQSMGLGTSTFLEGAPASRTAIQRRQSENETQMEQNGGLQRTKSIAQKIRRMNTRGGGGGGGSANRVTSPDAIEDGEANRSTGPRRPSSSKRPMSRNPFFQQDYDEAYEKKGASIQQAAEKTGYDDQSPVPRQRSISSPKSIPSLERRVTTGEIGDDTKPTTPEETKQSGGFMNRVKSLRRPRPERRPTTSAKNEGNQE